MQNTQSNTSPVKLTKKLANRPPLPNHFLSRVPGNERRVVFLFTKTDMTLCQILEAIGAYPRDTNQLREWLYDEIGAEAFERREKIARSIRMMRNFGPAVTMCGECGDFKPGKRDRETLRLNGTCERGGFGVDRCMECPYEKGLL